MDIFDKKKTQISIFQLKESYPDLILEQYTEEIASNLCDSYELEFIDKYIREGFRIEGGDNTDCSVVYNVIDDAFHNLENYR